MKITKLILAAYLLTSMAACDTDKNIAMYGEDSGAVRIEAAINTAFTRSNPGAAGDQQKQFNEGDEIQLSCEDGYLNYVLAGGKWVPTDNYYLRWGAEPVTYSAFYPVVSGASTANFTLPTNQQLPGSYLECLRNDCGCRTFCMVRRIGSSLGNNKRSIYQYD